MSTYPPIAAGQRLTAGLLAKMLPNVVVKTVQTAIASNTTLTIDPDLQMDLEANSVYIVEFVLYFAALNAADVKTSWTVPTNAAGLRSIIGPSSDAATATDADNITMRDGVHSFTFSAGYGGVRNSNTLGFQVVERGVVTTSNAGTCGINWAQVTTNTTASALFASSYMKALKVG